MIFQEPRLADIDHQVLEMIRKQRERLRIPTLGNPRRWLGTLRRGAFARAIQGSNSIEGYTATLDDVIAAIENEPPLSEKSETWFAINGYRDALTYIIQAAEDPYFEFSKQFLKSLHFMMINYDLSKYPGQWRPGTVFVVDRRGEAVYEAPPAEGVDGLVTELVSYLEDRTSTSTLVKAAMAHLSLTMIHPFKDGNGRMARALQTLVLAREGILHPAFCSIEEWLGRNTEAYYTALAAIGEGRWNPGMDALPWVRFCLKAHYQQAATMIRRSDEYRDLFEHIERIMSGHGLHDRTMVPLANTALGLRLTNTRYQADADVSQYVASRDLKKLSDLELIRPKGERRGRVYLAGKELRDARRETRLKESVADPYELAAELMEPRLPNL